MNFPRLSRSEQTSLLVDVVRRSAHAPGDTPPPVVVFDLDGTLMDNRPRTCAILHELGGLWATEHPALAERLRTATPTTLAYLVSDSLKKLGVVDAARVAEAHEYWKARFFRDEHLVHDIALEGSVSFARDCYAAGASLVYLTGRDLPFMGIGTFKSLRDLGFPIGVAGTQVILKPDAAQPDETFKREVAPALRRIGRVIAAFDNEPGNCNAFLEAYPECTSVFIDTQHMPGAPAMLSGVKIIEDFAR